MSDCTFRDNRSRGSGGAIYSAQTYSNWTLDRCDFADNMSELGGGAVHNSNAHTTFRDCVFTKNSSLVNHGGAVSNSQASRPTFIRCTLAGNYAKGRGGAIIDDSGDTSLINCLVAGNRAEQNGGAIWHRGFTSLTLLNSTVVANEAVLLGGGVYNNQATAVTNSILWANADAGGMDESAQVDGNAPTVQHSCIHDWTGSWGGQCNMGYDPEFVGTTAGTWTAPAVYDEETGQTTFFGTMPAWNNEPCKRLLNPDTSQYLQAVVVETNAGQITVLGDFREFGAVGTTYEINDYRLGAGSPCIDVGKNAAMAESDDLCGGERKLDDPNTSDCQHCPIPETDCGTQPIVDMGAYEYNRGCLDASWCDDGNMCTNDLCISGMCEHPFNTVPCNDGDVCTVGDQCQGGACAGTAADCSRLDEPCQHGVCDPLTGQCESQPANEGLTCFDGELCTVNDRCVVGACVGVVVDCSYLNSACAVGACNAATGACVRAPVNEGGACNDGNACTLNETCAGGTCGPGAPMNCDDGNQCTDDACINGACVHPPNFASCDDGDPCNGSETCNGQGTCVSSLATDCNGDGVSDDCVPPVGVRDLSQPKVYYCTDWVESIEITIHPPGGATAVSVEDTPPPGWTNVLNISGDGFYDAVHHKVKWGPFFAPFPASVSYEVGPPAGASGEQCFGTGIISVDGDSETVCGDRCLDYPYCPYARADDIRPTCAGCADCAGGCQDGRVEMGETIGYGCAWKQGCNDDICGMTRSAYLWRTGECYCWNDVEQNWMSHVCDSPASGCCEGGSVASSAVVIAPILIEVQVEAVDVEGVGVLARARIAKGALKARTQAKRFTINATPLSGTQASAFEVQVPKGWSVSTIDSAGAWDEAHRKVKWGPFFGCTPMTLIFEAKSSRASTASNRFTGTASCDGEDYPFEVR